MDTLCVQMSLMVLRHHPRTKGTDNNTNHTLAPTRGKRKGDLTRKPQGETRGTSMSSCNAFSRATAFYSRASCGRNPGPVSKRINLVLGPPPSIPGLMQSEPCHITQHPNTYTTSLSGRAGSHACVCVWSAEVCMAEPAECETGTLRVPPIDPGLPKHTTVTLFCGMHNTHFCLCVCVCVRCAHG